MVSLVNPAPLSAVTADTESPESFSEGVVKRQAIIRGSQYLGSTMTKTGLGLIAYGDKPTPLKRTSHLMPRDTVGKKQARSPDTRAKSPRNNKWGINYEQDIRSKSGTNNPSTRTGIRSRPASLGGRVLVTGGQLVPILGFALVADDVISDGSDSQTVEDIKYQSNRSRESIDTGLNFGKSLYSSPVGKIAISVALSKIGW